MSDQDAQDFVTDDEGKLPSGEEPLGERPPAMEGEGLEAPKTDEQGNPITPSGGRSSSG